MKFVLGLSFGTLALLAACSSAERNFDPGGEGGSGAAGGSGPGSGGAGASGSGGDSGCSGSLLDCDGSGECATDGKSDKDHCGSCDTKCFYGCNDSVCADPVQVSVGTTHACAVLGDGTVWCWGANTFGELGPGQGATETAPVKVTLPKKATAVSAGGSFDEDDDKFHEFSCALLEDKTVVCWGSGDKGQLGADTEADSAAPLAVVGLSNIRQISTGGQHACALQGSGDLFCWGLNDHGQVGDGSTTNAGTPKKIATSMKHVSAGEMHTCSVKSNGTVYCWGDPSEMKLGYDPVEPFGLTPGQVPGIFTADEVGAGTRHSCARLGTEIWCWGSDYNGQILQEFLVQEEPVLVDSAPPAKRMVIGLYATSAIEADGTITAWGSTYWADGNVAGGTGYKPVKVGKVLDYSIGRGYVLDSSSCAILETKELVCWGSDEVGQLGDGDPVADQLKGSSVKFE